MSYSDQAALSHDQDFILRLAACAAVELAPWPSQGQSPPGWAAQHAWEIAASPGFAADYASALAANVVRPGNDQGVISDGELLSAVQAWKAAHE